MSDYTIRAVVVLLMIGFGFGVMVCGLLTAI